MRTRLPKVRLNALVVASRLRRYGLRLEGRIRSISRDAAEARCRTAELVGCRYHIPLDESVDHPALRRHTVEVAIVIPTHESEISPAQVYSLTAVHQHLGTIPHYLRSC